ncbi:MarR family transcriptional regulator [Nocardia sp. CDC160]|uniref:MarR family transcriptional regulator n=1 Tax=Nocardia sp. CDC160 TaxID=3112166 RepID=UPI003FA359C8
MALTRAEAKVLRVLADSSDECSPTVRELSRATELPEASIRRALMRLERSGLAVVTPQSPARWRRTERGRQALHRPVYANWR